MESLKNNREEYLVEELRKSKEKFRNIFENMTVGVAFVDIKGYVIISNPALRKMLGYSEEELKNMTFTKFTHPEDVEKDLKLYSEMIAGERDCYTIEKRYITRSGNIIWGSLTASISRNKNGDIENIIGIVQDITEKKNNAQLFVALKDELNERKKTEKELYKLTCAVEHSPVSVVITDTRGCITYVNPKFTEVTGYSYEEVIGKNPRILNSGELPPEFYKKLWDTIKSGRVWNGEFRNIKKNGEYYWEAASIAPVFGDKGVITHYVSVKEDITGAKYLAVELRKAKDEAERANAAKSIFLANMSHEIRTPMNAILGFSQLLIKDGGINEKQRDYLESINKSGSHLIGLINDILEMSKIDAGRVTLTPSSFDLTTLVGDVERMLRVRAESKELKFIIKFDKKLKKYVVGDENKIRQIFINLIGNAIKFTEVGSITWTIKTLELPDGRIKIVSDVKDTGAGVAKEDLVRLFKAFEQTQTGLRAGGTGLGLTISQRFAEMMDGEITVISEVQKGSCFHVELIVMKHNSDEEFVEAISPNVIGLNDNRERRILIVDDIYENRLWLSELLKGVGFSSKEAANGVEAISLFKEWEPELILMDIQMPAMDGYEAAERIRSLDKSKSVPIIAITSRVFEEDKKKLTSSQFTGFILKPFREEELYKAIEDSIDIEYIYENNNTVISIKPEMECGCLRGLPGELADEMKEAIINGDLDILLELIESTNGVSLVDKIKLKELANNYQFEALLKLFK